MIWRRVKVSSDSTTANLYYIIIQIVMEWTDSHLHRFIIHGKDYGIHQIGGISFADVPNKIKLSDFDWRVKERFVYSALLNRGMIKRSRAMNTERSRSVGSAESA